MGDKTLFHNPELCSGCLCCQTACVQHNEGCGGLTKARLLLAMEPFTGDYWLTYCRQCEDAPCADACPSDAIYLHEGGYWEIDYDSCVQCNVCIDACPFGAMFQDASAGRVIKCHTCQGDPACVAACGTLALVWVAASEAAGRSEELPGTSE